MKENDLDRALRYMKPWQQEIILNHINLLKNEINDYIRVITSSIEEVTKYKLLASFIGFNNNNIKGFSLESLEFLNNHRKDRKRNMSIDEVIEILLMCDTYTIINKSPPVKLSDLKDLIKDFKKYEGSSLNDLKKLSNGERQKGFLARGS